MARVKRAVNAQKKRRTTLERASGYRGQRSRLYRKAKEQVTHSLVYSYNDRRKNKGNFRKLWIQRINAAARAQGMTYNRFIQGLTWPASRSTARSSPTSRSTTSPRSTRSSRPPAPRCPRTSTPPRPRPRPEPRRGGLPAVPDSPTPLTSGNTRVKDARKLARRSFRAERRLFLADGPKAVERRPRRPRLRGRGLRHRRAAAEQYADLAAARRRRWTLVEERALASLERQRQPRRASSRSAGSWTGRSTDVLDGRGPRAWSRCVPRSATPATPAPSSAARTRPGPTPSSSPALGRRLQPQDGARQRRQPLPPAGRDGAGRRPPPSRAARAAGLQVLAADGAGEVGPRRRRRELLAARPRGCSATRPGDCPPSWRRWPTTGSGSRSTAGPRASTWPPRRRSASTPPPGPAPRLTGACDGRRADDASP